MRVGFNPLRSMPAPFQYPEVLLTVITHLPNQEGYHKGRFEIVKKCLTSMRVENRPVLVWDNGSCPELLDWIERIYKPTFLVRSPNVGKNSAQAAIVRMVPPSTVISFSDDDILFTPDWLSLHLQLLKAFPNAGVVSGNPTRYSFRWGNQKTLEWAHAHGKVEVGRFLPDEWERDFAASIGKDGTAWLASTAADLDYKVIYNGVEAYATAQHCQFVTIASRIAPLLGFDAYAMKEQRTFDEQVDRAGLLRLSTIERCAVHMGNVLEAIA